MYTEFIIIYIGLAVLFVLLAVVLILLIKLLRNQNAAPRPAKPYQGGSSTLGSGSMAFCKTAPLPSMLPCGSAPNAGHPAEDRCA